MRLARRHGPLAAWAFSSSSPADDAAYALDRLAGAELLRPDMLFLGEWRALDGTPVDRPVRVTPWGAARSLEEARRQGTPEGLTAARVRIGGVGRVLGPLTGELPDLVELELGGGLLVVSTALDIWLTPDLHGEPQEGCAAANAPRLVAALAAIEGRLGRPRTRACPFTEVEGLRVRWNDRLRGG